MFFSEYGDKTFDICLYYDLIGEMVTVKLAGEAINDRLSICPSIISFDETYMGLKSFTTVEIKNETSVVAQFKWKKYKNAIDAAEARISGENTSK